MIELKDLHPKDTELTEEQKDNLTRLAMKLTKLEDAFGSLFKITSGFRTKEDQIRIYKARGVLDEALMKFGSQHLKGNAADIFDPRGNLKVFLNSDAGMKMYEKLGLYFENFSATLNWVHIQQLPPASGKRFFLP